MKNVEITDEQIANTLEMTRDELEFLKAKDPKSYEVFRFGALCKLLNLSEEDLITYTDKIKNTAETSA